MKKIKSKLSVKSETIRVLDDLHVVTGGTPNTSRLGSGCLSCACYTKDVSGCTQCACGALSDTCTTAC